MGNFKAYSWREDTGDRITGISKMVWATFNYGHSPKPPGKDYHDPRPPEAIADEIIPQLNALPQEDRVLFLSYVGQTRPAIFPHSDPEEKTTALANGGNWEPTEKQVRVLFQLLNTRGVKPSMVVLDYEGGSVYWGLGNGFSKSTTYPNAPSGWSEQLAGLESLFSKLKKNPFSYEPIDFVSNNKGVSNWGHQTKPVTEINNWQRKRINKIIRKCVSDPIWEAYNEKIPICNYADQVSAWEFADINNWISQERTSSQLAGNYSSPVLYVGATGNRYNKLTPEKGTALSWLDQRNEARAALEWTRRVSPWYSNPYYSYGSAASGYTPEKMKYVWAAGILHDHTYGVNTFLFWSGARWTDEEVIFVNNFLDKLKTVPSSRPRDIGKLNDSDPVATLNEWVDKVKILMGE